MDDERPGELLGSLVGGRQASQRKDFPVLHHGRYLTAMVIALDVGTSSTRASLYDAAGRPVPGRFRQIPYEPIVTRDGGVEHDAAPLLEAVAACLDGVLAGHKSPVPAVGVPTFSPGPPRLDRPARPPPPI